MIGSRRCFLSLLFTLAASSSPSIDGEYDYIIVGGGTSGLAVANRLSENPNINVLVIEAGSSVLNNSNVTDVNGYGLAFGTAIDWQYESVNQIYGGNSSQVLRAGKALSGTSAINGMAYTRAEDVQIDAWQAIGNTGWTWESLFPYYLKAENLTIPTMSQVEFGATYNPAYHSGTGPLDVAFTEMVNSTFLNLLNETFQSLGVPWSEDVNGGKMRGLSISPSTVNYQEYVREDAARAYYWPYASRGNLQVLLNTFVNHIELGMMASSNNVTASAVQVTYQNGTVGVINAKKEVILSAGSLKSPGILELSGIGNPRVLEQYNVTALVDLPGVGENLQDQMNTGMSGVTVKKVTGHTAVVYANVQDIFGNETGALSTLVHNNLKDYASATAKANGGVMSADDLEDLFQVQYDLIFNDEIPIAEILYYSGGGDSLVTQYWGLLPFSRGSVHIASSNPLIKPIINPNYFMLDWDNKLQIGIAKFIRRAYETYPLRTLVKAESSPGLQTVPQNASDAKWMEWIVKHYRSNFHPVGTAAMMPREKGGVVSENLLVYGTTNVRVVDASVLPYQIDGHLVSTLYAIAERAADFIKQSEA